MPILDEVLTAEGSPNIALVKYWGKRDDKLILPCNSSVSLTLSSDVIRTTTSVMFSKKLKEDTLYIDGIKQDLKNTEINERLWILEHMRNKAKTDAHALIVSKNDFPAASGLASSASGIATLAYVMNEALGLKLNPKELSIIARQGSGSSCRSIFGGMVVWKKGEREDGKDSYAEQVFNKNYWPEVLDSVLIVSQVKKKFSSRAGMKHTVDTNPLYKVRPEVAERRVIEVIEAYRRRDFNALAEHVMADSNEFHALALSTRPSLRYLNPVSYKIMDAIEELNYKKGENIAAYTFDAGPNAHIITLDENQEEVLNTVKPLINSKEIMEVRTSGVGEGPRMIDNKSLIDTKKLGPMKV